MVHVSRLVQPELPRDRRALHQRRHDGVHAVHRGRSVQGFPDAAVHHSAWRRRGAVSLGPLSRAAQDMQAAAARRARHATTCSSTPACITSRASTCCCKVIAIDNILFGSEMVGAVRGIDPQTGHYFDDTQALHRRAAAHRSRQAPHLRAQCAPRVSAPRRAAQGTRYCRHCDKPLHAIGFRGLAGAFHPRPSRPAFRPPPGAVDAHCHVFGPGDAFPVRARTQVHAVRRAEGKALGSCATFSVSSAT